MKIIPKIGFVCAYTPLALIDAAGCSPYRMLPTGDWPDQAGHLLHDNICPNVKRLIDRALNKDLPDLTGVVFINSCDAMRRMADAWHHVRKNEKVILLDLPANSDESARLFFKSELERLVETLESWTGRKIHASDIMIGLGKMNKISSLLSKLSLFFRRREIKGGRAALQKLYNDASMQDFEKSIFELENLTRQAGLPDDYRGVPVFMFGNVMPDAEAFSLIESCGAVIADDDFCTGSRMFPIIEAIDEGDILHSLSTAILSKTPCARTFDPKNPLKIAEQVLINARTVQACGVIGHTIKFCDPYLERLPVIRNTLREANMPLLLLEGDCTLRSIGQQKTRIEAFIEMLR